MMSVLDVAESVERVEVPRELYETPEYQEVLTAAVDISGWANDIDSFVKEVIIDGDVNNLVLALQFVRGCSLQQAVDECAAMVRTRIETYISAERLVAHFVDASGYPISLRTGIYRCLAGYRSLIRGYVDWAKLTRRYSHSIPSEHEAPVESMQHV